MITYISATDPNTGRRHTVDLRTYPGYLAEYIAPNLAELGYTDISRTDSDGSVSLLKSDGRPFSPRQLARGQEMDQRDQQDKDRVGAAIRDSGDDYRAGRIGATRVRLLHFLGSCQPPVPYRIPTV